MAETQRVVVENSGKGIGFCGLLTIVFVVLKLNPGGLLTTGVVDWSWWWVLSPLWIPAALMAVFCVVAAILAIFAACLGCFSKR